MSLFESGVRPSIDSYLQKKADEVRDYGEYWSASGAGYCQRKMIFDRLKVPHTKEQDARKTRVFEVGHIFHKFLQDITKEAGISIAQEVELQDEDIMVRGHFDDLVLVREPTGEIEAIGYEPGVKDIPVHVMKDRLILYDYKTQNSRAFTYQKGKPMSFYHRMQLGTYMYMLRKEDPVMGNVGNDNDPIPIAKLKLGTELTEARILKISKDDLRMSEQQLLWDEELEADVLSYWNTLNQYWRDKKIPPCTCADHEGGFLARENYNDYFYQDEPCSIVWMRKTKEEGLWQHPDEKI